MEFTDNLHSFAIRLRSAMSRKGCTLREVGAAVGMSTSSVGAWTQGKNWPEVETLKRLAQYLGVSTDYLITGKTDESEFPVGAEDMVVEEAAPRSPDSPAVRSVADLRGRFERLLLDARGDAERLGWISQQMHAHLAPPRHWFTDAQLAAREAERQQLIDAAKARMPELRDPAPAPAAKAKAG